MSNFMHKVKDAMSDPHDRDTGRGFKSSNKFDDTGDNYGSSNPSAMNQNPNQYNSSGMSSGPGSGAGSGYGSGGYQDPNFDETRNTGGSINPLMGNRGDNTGSDTYGSNRMGGDGPTNAGPHDSKLANKMDPRVDSDLDNRGKYAGNTGSQNTGGGTRGFNPNTAGSMQQPGMQGSDNHMTSEENYSTSTQEHKSHSSTSHTAPGQMGSQAQPGFGGGGQTNLGGGQQNFSGGAAPGGSSYNDNTSGMRGPSGGQNTDPMNKLDPRVNRSNEQQNTIGNQRGVY